MSDWLDAHPEVTALRAASPDLNGIARGKRLPRDAATKVLAGELRFPFSVLNLDLLGNDIEDSPLVLASGDQDGALMPTGRGPVPMPWLGEPSALIPVWMSDNSGKPFQGDPRHALSAVVETFTSKGLQPVVAAELEFILSDTESLAAPPDPLSGNSPVGAEILSLTALDRFEPFFNDLYMACARMDLPADTAISESGTGQYEVNLKHQTSALKAADDAWLFKMLVKGMARKHGLRASFMAKPYADAAGNGLHMHVSVLDQDGRNIFDDGSETGSASLLYAIAGCLKTLAPATLIFAPFANSYDRFVPGAHAPTGIAWAFENRTAAIRVPGGPPAARRIEHRLSGGDANPYLAMAALLGGILTGLTDAELPPDPITGNAYEQELPQIPTTWEAAISCFATDTQITRIFSPQLIENLVLTKRQEARVLANLSAEQQTALYLDTL